MWRPAFSCPAFPSCSCVAELRTHAGPWPRQSFGQALVVRFATGLAHTGGTAGTQSVFLLGTSFKILIQFLK